MGDPGLPEDHDLVVAEVPDGVATPTRPAAVPSPLKFLTPPPLGGVRRSRRRTALRPQTLPRSAFAWFCTRLLSEG